MIYMVEHVFALPELENEWNAWYAVNVSVLLSVPGFRSAQRFKVPAALPSRYMAMYTIDSASVLESKAYKDAGGGGTNSQRFRPAYQVWIRNLFDGLERAPAVPVTNFLAVLDSTAPDCTLPGQALPWLKSVGLHKTTPYRGLAIVTKNDLGKIQRVPGMIVYQPLTPQHGPVR